MVIGFDWDGTLVEPFTATPLPGVRERLAELPEGTRTFIASNQAGPVFREKLWDTKYPTVARVAEQLEAGLAALDWRPDLLLICTHPGRDAWEVTANDIRHALRDLLVPAALRLGIRSLMIYNVSGFRKPAPGMLLEAARHFGVAAADLLYIGDMVSDQQAAVAAGCRYLDAVEWRERGLL